MNGRHANPDEDVELPKQKTNIICTLGPVSRAVDVLERMLRAGMRVARFNFSHGSHEYHQETLDALRVACDNTGIFCAVLLDTKGPEIRTGMLENGEPVLLEKDQKLVLTTDYSRAGNARTVAVSYPSLARDVSPGSKILCADGSITLTVISCDEKNGTVLVNCENAAKLGERKNMNLPGVCVDLPTITEKDRDDLLNWGVKNKVDFVAASFVRKGEDVKYIREVLGKAGATINIISKVENMEGLDNYDDIVAQSDGVMVARGDLGMEIHLEQIFLAQKRMIKRCNEAGKPVVTATQMLESMVKNPRPTRAEATDVANAVLDGTDCVMLSGETAAGAFPVDAVRVMSKICREAEVSIDHYNLFKSILASVPTPMAPLESLASSAVRTAQKVRAALIVVLTHGGSTARLVAKYRPAVPVLTVFVPTLTTDSLTWTCSGENPARQANLTRGLIPLLAEGSARATDTDTTDEILSAAIEHAKLAGYCQAGECIVALHRIGNASVIKIVNID